MLKISLLTIVLLLCIGLSSQALATNGTQIGAVGARALGMGGSFRGLANDWSAAYFNPAGLTQMEGKWTFGFSGAYIMPRGSHTPHPFPAQNLPFSGYYTNEREAVKRNFPVPALGIFFKPSDAFVVGLGVYAPNGLGAGFDVMTIPASYGNTTGFSREDEHYSDHMVINIQPTFALKVSDFLSVGLGLSYMWGKMDLNMGMLAYNPAAANWAALQGMVALAVGGGALPPGTTLGALTADQYRLATELGAATSGSAYGANFGLLFTFSDQFQMGLNARYNTDLKLSGDLTQTYIMHGDAAKLAVLGNPALAPYFAGAGIDQTEIAGLFSGQNVKILDAAEMEADLPMPMEIGGGIAFRPSPKLTITADAKWTNWAKWDKITIRPTGADELELHLNWENTIEVMAGIEAMLFENNGNQFFVRGGFYTVDTPVPDETLNPTLLDPARRFGITGGLGMNFGGISIDAAVEYVMFGEKDVTTYGFDATGIQDNYAGLYDFKALILYIGTTIDLN